MTTTSKKTPRVEALNRLLTWVEEAEQQYDDATDFDKCEIEERVSCFITFVVGNTLIDSYKDKRKINVVNLIMTTVSAVRDLFDVLDITDNDLATEFVTTSVVAACSVSLDLDPEDDAESEAIREVVISRLDALFKLQVQDLVAVNPPFPL